MATESKRSIRVFLIDRQAILRSALRCLLERASDICVVGEAGAVPVATMDLARVRPDLLLMDLPVQGVAGFEAIRTLRRTLPETPILMLSAHEEEFFVSQALRAGADGFLAKDSDPSELLPAIRTVADGRSYMSPRVSHYCVQWARAGGGEAEQPRSGMDLLTVREREVFQALALGCSNKEVAAQLGLRPGTVKKHRENLQRKLDSHSAADLARLAIHLGLLDP